MGDGADMRDIERFLRSPEGKASLEEIALPWRGRTIKEVNFGGDVSCVVAGLELDNGDEIEVMLPGLDVDYIRCEFAEVLERETYNDDDA